MICETCLGNNPYMRMTKLPFGSKICKVSNLPYQPFRWKAGTNGRFKETIICLAVAKEKNICQACLNDMQFGLPVGVRDAMLRQHASQGMSLTALAPVHSLVGTQYHYQQLSNQQEDESYGGGSSELALEVAEYQQNEQMIPQQQLMHDFSQRLLTQNVAHRTYPLEHSNPSTSAVMGVSTKVVQRAPEAIAFRNLPKLCTFWLNGTCRRVTTKSCPFRPCCKVYQFPELAGGDASMREANKKLIEQLEADGPDKVQRNMDKTVRQAFQDAIRGRKDRQQSSKGSGGADENIRARVHGTDSLSQKYLGQLQGQIDKTKSQEDIKQSEILKGTNDTAYQSVKSLWIGNLPPVQHENPNQEVNPDTAKSILRQTLWTALQRFGIPVVSVHVAQNIANAFIEYPSHELALHALQLMLYDPPLIPSPVLLLSDPHNAQSAAATNVSWQQLTLIRWATPPSLKRGRESGSSNEVEIMPPPPGMEQMHPSVYSLPNAKVPRLPTMSQPAPPPNPPPPLLPKSSAPSLPTHTTENANTEEFDYEADRTKKRRVENDATLLGNLLSGYGSSDEEKV